ncbi:fasciclin domain-containing protein [Methanooceanicella nereidis]|nr:fasciclin domain-containing protein [Methanocella sp. CWC-04]
MNGLKKALIILLLTMLLLFTAISVQSANNMADRSIYNTLLNKGEFSTMLKAVNTAGMESTLSDPGPFTVFAPDNVAFDKLSIGTVKALTDDKEMMTDVLKYHVVPGKYTAEDLKKMKEVKTIDGRSLKIKTIDGDIMVDGARVIGSPIDSKNGIIFKVDKVLIPQQTAASQKTIFETLSAANDLTTLSSAVKAADMGDLFNSTGPYTLFAPDDSAFDKLPFGTVRAWLGDKVRLGNVLRYHVVPGKYSAEDLKDMKQIKTKDGKTLPVRVKGEEIMVGDAKVTGPDLECSNGIIHKVDTVLIPEDEKALLAPGQVTRGTGTLLDWIGLLLAGLLIAGILFVLLPWIMKKRGESRYEEAMELEKRRAPAAAVYGEAENITFDESAVNELKSIDKSKLAGIRKYIIGSYNNFKDMVDLVRDAHMDLIHVRDMDSARRLSEKYSLNPFNSSTLELALEKNATIYTKDRELMEKYRAAGARTEDLSKLITGA